MIKKILFATHLILSILFAIAIKFTINDIFSVGKDSIGNYFLFTCPSCLVIPTVFLSFGYLLQKPRPKTYYLPIVINMITIVASISLYQFENSHPDYAFQRHYSSYDEVIKLVETGELAVNDEGIVLLPATYSEIFRNNVAYSLTDKGTMTIYFEDGYDNFDNISWGYIYRADGSQPSNKDKCFQWRDIVPPTPNWFYCDVRAFIGFPVNTKAR